MKNIFQFIKKNILVFSVIVVVFASGLLVAQAQQYNAANPKPDAASASRVKDFFGETTEIINRIGSFAIDPALYMPTWISSDLGSCINQQTLTDENNVTGSESCLSVVGTSRFSSLRVKRPAHFLLLNPPAPKGGNPLNIIVGMDSLFAVGDLDHARQWSNFSKFVVDDTVASNESILIDGLKRISSQTFLPRDATSTTSVCASSTGVMFLCGTSGPAITYGWVVGDWGACSSGSQSRTVNCQDSNGTVIADSFCTTAKPATTQSCTDPVDGVCGTANLLESYTIPPFNVGKSTKTLCSTGTSSAVTENPSNANWTWTWNCTGTGGGTDASCLTVKNIDAVCGTSNGGTFAMPPTTGLCDALTPTASAVTTNATTYTWACKGSGGGTFAACSANIGAALPVVNGTCGSANGGNYTSTPTSGLCSAGTAGAVSTGSTTYDWTCAGSNGGASSACQANISAAPTNGACGASDGGNYASAPNSGLCNTGNASSVTTNPSTYDWSCNGTNGGTTDSCQASITTYSWFTGGWGLCFSGNQTRTVECRDNSGNTVNDALCTKAKPITSQSCSGPGTPGNYFVCGTDGKWKMGPSASSTTAASTSNYSAATACTGATSPINNDAGNGGQDFHNADLRCWTSVPNDCSCFTVGYTSPGAQNC